MSDNPREPQAGAAEPAAPETPLCRDVKRGRVDLTCELPPGHEPEWHKAVCVSRQEITTHDTHHVVGITETVTWEPVDHVKEAVRHLMKGADRD